MEFETYRDGNTMHLEMSNDVKLVFVWMSLFAKLTRWKKVSQHRIFRNRSEEERAKEEAMWQEFYDNY